MEKDLIKENKEYYFLFFPSKDHGGINDCMRWLLHLLDLHENKNGFTGLSPLVKHDIGKVYSHKHYKHISYNLPFHTEHI